MTAETAALKRMAKESETFRIALVRNDQAASAQARKTMLHSGQSTGGGEHNPSRLVIGLHLHAYLFNHRNKSFGLDECLGAGHNITTLNHSIGLIQKCKNVIYL